MNVIGVLKTEINKFNTETKCGLCWEFVPGGRKDYFNNIELIEGEECCVYVGVTEIKTNSGFVTSGEFVRKEYTDWNVKMFAGIPSSLDIQFYNENPEHPEVEGKWEKYINPIFECFGSGCVEMDLCNIHNCKGLTTVEVVKWSSTMVMNYNDMNLDGIEIQATFREYSN